MATKRFGIQRLRPWLSQAVRDAGFSTPTKIQAAAMPLVAKREHVLLHAATGSGKTLAFLLPLLSRLDEHKPAQLLVLLPSRELALQTATEVQRLVESPSPLSLALVVGGAGVNLHRQLEHEVSARRAEVIVATPPALLSAILAEERGRPHRMDRNSLLMRMALNLDAIVLDEVDALLTNFEVPRKKRIVPSYHATQNTSGRSMTPRRSPTARLLLRLTRALRVASDPWEWPRRTKIRERPMQVVAASATVGRSTLREVQSRLLLPEPPRVVGCDGAVAARARRGEARQLGMRVERRPGALGVAGVEVPRSITHRYHIVPDDSDKPMAVAHTLGVLQLRSALVVLANGSRLGHFVEQLHAAGLPHARVLHERLGFASKPRTAAAVPSADSERGTTSGGVEHLLKVAGTLMTCGEDVDTDPLVLVTTESSIRGIDLPHCECVVLAYSPHTSEAYVHAAGRTGRGGLQGTALSVLTSAESRKLGLFSSQLGISIKRLDIKE